MVVRLTVTGQVVVSPNVLGDIDGDDYVGVYTNRLRFYMVGEVTAHLTVTVLSRCMVLTMESTLLKHNRSM